MATLSADCLLLNGSIHSKLALMGRMQQCSCVSSITGRCFKHNITLPSWKVSDLPVIVYPTSHAMLTSLLHTTTQQFILQAGKSRSRASLPHVGFARLVTMTPALMSQVSAQLAIRSQFPLADFSQVRWPILEDVINDEAFLGFRAWIQQQGESADGPLGPMILPRAGVHVARASLAEQSGAAARKSSLPPLVPFGLEPEEHFAYSQYIHELGTPLESPVELDRDLHFAAHEMVAHYSHLIDHRAACVYQLKVLSDRLSPVSDLLRAQQVPSVRAANPKVHLALIAMLVCLLQWPDTSFCHHLFTGFPAVGSLAPCGIWDSQPVDFISLQDVLQQGKDDGQQLMQHLRPSTDDDVIHEAGAKDEANGWCSAPFPPSQLTQYAGYRLIKRFVITQFKLQARSGSLTTPQQAARVNSVQMVTNCSSLQPCNLANMSSCSFILFANLDCLQLSFPMLSVP